MGDAEVVLRAAAKDLSHTLYKRLHHLPQPERLQYCRHAVQMAMSILVTMYDTMGVLTTWQEVMPRVEEVLKKGRHARLAWKQLVVILKTSVPDAPGQPTALHVLHGLFAVLRVRRAQVRRS